MEGANAQRVRVPVAEFAAKMETKKEVYDFLSQNVKAYLPPKDVITIWHLKDLAAGKKGLIKGEQVRHLAVPQYDSISVEAIRDWAKARYPQMLGRYFPIEREYMHFPRQVSPLFCWKRPPSSSFLR